MWHLTSLDAPTVAAVWTLAFAWAARIQLPLWLPTLLALSAWSVYIGDRLLDARNAQTPLRHRHHFHWKHRRLFIPVAMGSAVAAIAVVLRSMPVAARERNSVLAAAALLYFTSIHSPWRLPERKLQLRVPKELLVGILFTLACATPTLARIDWSFDPGRLLSALLPLLTYIALAWLNCHAIEKWESTPHYQTPAPRIFDSQTRSIFSLAVSLATATLLAASAEAAMLHQREAAILVAGAFSAAMLAFLDRHKSRLTPVTLRAAADLVLLFPIVLLTIR